MVLYVDGGCSGNDQRDLSLRQMVMVVTDHEGMVLSEAVDRGGSNNIAELRAVRNALLWCAASNVADVEIRTDSMNNLAWVLGKKVGKRLNDRETVLTLKAEIERLRQNVRLKLVWVGRDDNKAGHYIERKFAL